MSSWEVDAAPPCPRDLCPALWGWAPTCCSLSGAGLRPFYEPPGVEHPTDLQTGPYVFPVMDKSMLELISLRGIFACCGNLTNWKEMSPSLCVSHQQALKPHSAAQISDLNPGVVLGDFRAPGKHSAPLGVSPPHAAWWAPQGTATSDGSRGRDHGGTGGTLGSD